MPALEKVHDKEIKFEDRSCSAEQLYQNYSNILKPLSDVPVDRMVYLEINGKGKIGIRASTKYFIIVNIETKISEAIISVRSNNAESWKSLQVLAQTFHVEIPYLIIMIKNENKICSSLPVSNKVYNEKWEGYRK
ncbi:MAG: hypothetical protein R3Y24_07075 [Eubacteriales bacterium]